MSPKILLILIDDDQGSGVELELADARSLQWEELFVQTVLSENHQVQLLLITGVLLTSRLLEIVSDLLFIRVR